MFPETWENLGGDGENNKVKNLGYGNENDGEKKVGEKLPFETFFTLCFTALLSPLSSSSSSYIIGIIIVD